MFRGGLALGDIA